MTKYKKKKDFANPMWGIIGFFLPPVGIFLPPAFCTGCRDMCNDNSWYCNIVLCITWCRNHYDRNNFRAGSARTDEKKEPEY